MSPLDQLLQKIDIGAQLLRSWSLTDGISARVTALEVRWTSKHTEKLVVREYGMRDLQANPAIAQQEYQLLRILNEVGLFVPAPRYTEPGLIVTEFMDGETNFNPNDETGFVRQMAAFLARLHAIPYTTVPFLHPLALLGPHPTHSDDSLSESRIRDTLERVGQLPSSFTAVLHGDFWPGNLLWQSGRLSAVIDWEDAASGDPLADVGNARLELLFFLGADAMQAFTREYVELTGINLAHLPYWDLRAALRLCGQLSEWGLEKETEQRMRQRHGEFVERAIAALNA